MADTRKTGQLKDPNDYATDDDETLSASGGAADAGKRGKLKDPADYATDDEGATSSCGSVAHPTEQDERQSEHGPLPDGAGGDDHQKRLRMLALVLFSNAIHEQTRMKLSSAAKRKLLFLLPDENRSEVSNPGEAMETTSLPKKKRGKYNIEDTILVPESWLRELAKNHQGLVTGATENSDEAAGDASDASGEGTTRCNLCGKVRKGHSCEFKKVFKEWLENLAKSHPELLPRPPHIYLKILLVSAPLQWLRQLLESSPELVPEDIRQDMAAATAADSEFCLVSKEWIRNLLDKALRRPDAVPAGCKEMCKTLLCVRYEQLKEILRGDPTPASLSQDESATGAAEAEAGDDSVAIEGNEPARWGPDPDQGSGDVTGIGDSDEEDGNVVHKV